jgi:hypothetical protein
VCRDAAACAQRVRLARRLGLLRVIGAEEVPAAIGLHHGENARLLPGVIKGLLAAEVPFAVRRERGTSLCWNEDRRPRSERPTQLVCGFLKPGLPFDGQRRQGGPCDRLIVRMNQRDDPLPVTGFDGSDPRSRQFLRRCGRVRRALGRGPCRCRCCCARRRWRRGGTSDAPDDENRYQERSHARHFTSKIGPAERRTASIIGQTSMTDEASLPEVTRWLRWYGVRHLVGEVQLRDITLQELRALFSVSAEDPMYDCFRVQAPQVARLELAASDRIDLHRFAYFVEADAADGVS